MGFFQKIRGGISSFFSSTSTTTNTNPEANKTQNVAQGVFPLIPNSQTSINSSLNKRLSDTKTTDQDVVSEIANKTLGTGKVPRQKKSRCVA